MNDDFSAMRDLLRAALAEPDETELVAMRAGLREKLARERTRTRSAWLWVLAPAALVVCALALLLWPKPQVQVMQPRPLQLAAAPLAGRALVLPVVAGRAQRRRLPLKAGMRAATVLVAADGSSRLRIDTNDPKIVILIPLNEKTDEEQN